MHATKIILLLVLTLVVMRLGSWSLGWLLNRFGSTNRLWIAVISNGISLAAFGCFLVTQRIPGELIDPAALTFGVVVFSVYALIDIRCTRWTRTKPGENRGS